MSICKHHFEKCMPQTLNEMDFIFQQGIVSFESYCETPEQILKDSNLVARINGQYYYEWSKAQSIIMSYLVFK